MTQQNNKNFTSYLTQFRMHDYMLDCTAINIANSTGTSYTLSSLGDNKKQRINKFRQGWEKRLRIYSSENSHTTLCIVWTQAWILLVEAARGAHHLLGQGRGLAVLLRVLVLHGNRPLAESVLGCRQCIAASGNNHLQLPEAYNHQSSLELRCLWSSTR